MKFIAALLIALTGTPCAFAQSAPTPSTTNRPAPPATASTTATSAVSRAADPAAMPATPSTAASAPAAPVNPLWAGEWRSSDFNLPPINTVLVIRREATGARLVALLAGTECPLGYDGLMQAADIVKRIDERAQFQLKTENWPAGTNTAELVGLRKEFDQALRLARSLPPGGYRVVRAPCSTLSAADDRFYVLNEGKRLFEFRFPAYGLGMRVTQYERAR